MLRRLIGDWAAQPDAAWTSRLSEISDDGTPIEFSIAIGEHETDVRVLFEAQAASSDLEAHRLAALALHERLERDFGADLTRFRAVVDLFAPPGMQGPFAMWNSVVFSKDKPPSFKTYFNPQARGIGHAPALVDEAMERLGLPNAWSSIAAHQTRRGPWLDEIKYFALDLEPGDRARIKVYARHHDAAPEDLEAACSGQRAYIPGEAAAFANALGGEGPLSARATFTCSAFTEGHDDRPATTTLYIPVCAYGHDDAKVRDRIESYLASQSFDSSVYTRVLTAFAGRPLDAGVGMQSWLSAKRDPRGGARITVYLATEANRVYPPGSVPAADVSRSVYVSAGGAKAFLSRYCLASHPLLAELQRGSRSQVTRRDVDFLVAAARRAVGLSTPDVAASCPEVASIGHELGAALTPFADNASAVEALEACVAQLDDEAEATTSAFDEEPASPVLRAVHGALWTMLGWLQATRPAATKAA